MINLDINILGVSIKFSFDIKMPKKAKKRAKDAEKHEETPIYEDSQIDYLFDENKIAKIANQFEKDLKDSPIYAIPQHSDIPPRHKIQDDVEIITDDFEKEIEDIIEGRR